MNTFNLMSGSKRWSSWNSGEEKERNGIEADRRREGCKLKLTPEQSTIRLQTAI